MVARLRHVAGGDAIEVGQGVVLIDLLCQQQEQAERAEAERQTQEQDEKGASHERRPRGGSGPAVHHTDGRSVLFDQTSPLLRSSSFRYSSASSTVPTTAPDTRPWSSSSRSSIRSSKSGDAW